MFYSIEEAEEILNFFRKSIDIHQLPEYLKTEAFWINAEARYWIKQKDGNVFILPLLKRSFRGYFDFTSPYGYSGYYSDFKDPQTDLMLIKQFFEESQKEGIISTFLRLNPVYNNISIQQKGIVQKLHGNIIYIDLSQNYEYLKKCFSDNHKRDIKKNSNLLVVEKGRDSDLEIFLKIYYETLDRKLANEYYYFNPEYIQKLYKDLDLKLYLVRDAYQDIIGGALFMVDNKSIYYYVGATKTSALKLSPLKSLFDYIISEYQATGKILWLGGGFGSQEDSLLRFKKGFSQVSVTFSTLRMVHNPSIYKDLSEKNPDSEFFPSYREVIKQGE